MNNKEFDNKVLDELLEKNFTNVNTWLNFAEAKNAANIAFVVACMAVIFNFKSITAPLYAVCFLLLLSGIFSLLSFMPKLGKTFEKHNCATVKKKEKNKEPNLIFFEDIKIFNGDSYIQKVCKEYYDSDKHIATKYQLDLSREIVYNSNIASNKYMFFKWAVSLDTVALAILLFCIIVA